MQELDNRFRTIQAKIYQENFLQDNCEYRRKSNLYGKLSGAISSQVYNTVGIRLEETFQFS